MCEFNKARSLHLFNIPEHPIIMEHITEYTVCWTTTIVQCKQQYYSDLNIGSEISQHNSIDIDLITKLIQLFNLIIKLK